MIGIKKAFIILLTFSVLFIAFMTGFGFIAIALFAPIIVPFVISTFNGAVSLFSSKLLMSFAIGIVGSICIIPFYHMMKKMGLWIKGKYKKVKGIFRKKFGKKKDMETQTEQLEYPDPGPELPRIEPNEVL